MAISMFHSNRSSTILLQTSAHATQQQPPLPSDVTGWALLIAASIWIAQKALEIFVNKEKQESDLTQTLISDLRADRANLLKGNQEGFQQVVSAVSSQTIRTTEELRDLSSLISKFSETLHYDVQKTLVTQTDIYAESKRELSKLRQLIEQIDCNIKILLESHTDSNS